MKPREFYCPRCDRRVRSAYSGRSVPFCPRCEEPPPEDVLYDWGYYRRVEPEVRCDALVEAQELALTP